MYYSSFMFFVSLTVLVYSLSFVSQLVLIILFIITFFLCLFFLFFFFFQAEDGIRDVAVTGVQTCALPICLHEFRKTVAFNEHTRGRHSLERLLNTFSELRICRDHPMHIRRTRVPVTSRVFALLVCLFSSRTNQRFFAEQMTDATRVRIFSARSIMTARGLDRLPTRKRTQQFTHQRRLANVGRVTTNTDDHWITH